MLDLPQPSRWFHEHFGDYSQRMMFALAASGEAAHVRAMDAKAGSRLPTDDAYGASFWLALPQEMVERLDFLPDREVIRPRQSRYELVVFERVLVFPVKCVPDSTHADHLKLRSSGFRRRVFSLEGQAGKRVEEQLDFGDVDPDFAEPAVALGSFGSAKKVVLVAYECSARGGLQHVYVGEATLDKDGTVNWIHREELPLDLIDGERTTLRRVDDGPTRRFDEAPIPETDLRIMEDGEVSDDRGDERPLTGTEGDADDRP